MGKLRVRLIIALLSLADVVAGTISRRSAEPWCRRAGTLWYVFAPSARRAVRGNLTRILGRFPSWREVRAVFQYGVLNYWDTFALPHLSREEVLALVHVQGGEYLREAAEGGKGTIIATAHLGSVALAGQFVSAWGYKLTSLVEAIEPPELLEFFTRHRQAFGTRLIPANASAMRELLRSLRENEIVGLITDRDVLSSGIEVQFFGAPTRFPAGTAALALRTGAPVITGANVRNPDGSFNVYLDAPLPRPESGDRNEDLHRLTQVVAERLEYHVRQHPEQWTVFQPRWPTPSFAGTE